MNGIWRPAVYNPRITFLGMQIFWLRLVRAAAFLLVDRKSTRLNSSHYAT
jgi:hypothetical protein